MHYQLFKLSQYLRGWINYFGIAKGYQRCVDLEKSEKSIAELSKI
jgi:RNA-directed DNA polymerase